MRNCLAPRTNGWHQVLAVRMASTMLAIIPPDVGPVQHVLAPLKQFHNDGTTPTTNARKIIVSIIIGPPAMRAMRG